ncbi:MAG: M20 metallopeptidase family protein [Isosphaeraceae bacterium]
MTLTRVRVRLLLCTLLSVPAVPAFVKAADPLAVPAQTTTSQPDSFDAWFAPHQSELVELYKHLHTHPELSFQEHETSKRIAEELRKTGADVTPGVGKLGVVGIIKNGAGPVVLVRTDMDALPVVEETGLPYASKVKARDKLGREVGVMHACGHDVHMTCFVATAQWLAANKDRWSGTVVMVAQPAEEAVDGARAMLDDGLYSRFPKPDFALALHCRPDEPVGTVQYCSGPALASSTSVNVTIRGKGGHGAWPHRTTDPIVLASLVVLDLQTIVSREIEPSEPAVLTVGSIHGGTKHNIIPDEVKLQLTLRSFSEPVRQQLIAGIKRRAMALAQAHQAPEPSVEIEESTPPTINTPSLVERVVPAIGGVLGPSNVKPAKPVMGAEDFGLFSEGNVPIFMFWLGTLSPERINAAKSKDGTLPALHSSKYYPEPGPSIETGVRAMTAAIARLLPPKK